MADNIQVQENDVGLRFLIQINDYNNQGNPVNLNGASNFIVYFKRPDHTIFQVNGSLTTDGTDGLIQYITKSGDMNIQGRWIIQVSYNIQNSLIYTSKSTFMVVSDLID